MISRWVAVFPLVGFLLEISTTAWNAALCESNVSDIYNMRNVLNKLYAEKPAMQSLLCWIKYNQIDFSEDYCNTDRLQAERKMPKHILGTWEALERGHGGVEG